MIARLLQTPKTTFIFIASCCALVLNIFASRILNASYEASKFPVPYFEAQLSFSAEKIKDWYSYLIEQNTLGVYIKTQHIDFVFIVSVLLLHFFVLLLISRLYPPNHRGRRALVLCALLSTVAPIADAIENLISYVMLLAPTRFPDGLALVYSSFAALKFAMFTFAYISATIGLILGLFYFIRSRISQGSKATLA